MLAFGEYTLFEPSGFDPTSRELLKSFGENIRAHDLGHRGTGSGLFERED
jgi:hypothetical protein